MKNTTRTAAPLRPAFATIPYSAARALFACVACCALAPHAAAACSGRLHVEVADSAVYALDYATIVAQQPALRDCAADELTLLNRGVEVPIRVTGASDGKFGDGARIEWVGQRLHGPQSWYDTYSNVNVYQLAAQPGKHARMHEVFCAQDAAAAVAAQRPRRAGKPEAPALRPGYVVWRRTGHLEGGQALSFRSATVLRGLRPTRHRIGPSRRKRPPDDRLSRQLVHRPAEKFRQAGRPRGRDFDQRQGTRPR